MPTWSRRSSIGSGQRARRPRNHGWAGGVVRVALGPAGRPRFPGVHGAAGIAGMRDDDPTTVDAPSFRDGLREELRRWGRGLSAWPDSASFAELLAGVGSARVLESAYPGSTSVIPILAPGLGKKPGAAAPYRRRCRAVSPHRKLTPRFHEGRRPTESDGVQSGGPRTRGDGGQAVRERASRLAHRPAPPRRPLAGLAGAARDRGGTAPWTRLAPWLTPPGRSPSDR